MKHSGLSKEKTGSGGNARGAAARASRRDAPDPVLSPIVALPAGFGCAVTRKGRLAALEWENTRKGLALLLREKYPGAAPGRSCRTGACRMLRDYADGKVLPAAAVASLSFEWERVRPFSRTVLRKLLEVPYGSLITYGELASRCGNPRAARAVGNALSRNPWPVLVPCHRVIGADGTLAGFGKGIEAKEALIRHERKSLARRAGA